MAIDSLNLDVRAGDIYGFLGPNGSGKTTAIRCILRLLQPDGGQVEIFGETDPRAQRRHVGAMVETPAFYSWMSGRKNLEFSAAYAGITGGREIIDQALTRVGLIDRASDPVRAYSLGMRQRLGIARALVGQPRLLILDEPTNGLDPRGMKEVRDLLVDLARRDGLTVFVSSHLLGEVEQLCTRVGILEHGRLVFEGETADMGKLTTGDGGTRVDIGAKDASKLASALAGIAGARVEGDGEAGRVRVRLDGVEIAALNRALVQAGVDVDALVPVINKLEDVFLSVTSREIT